MQFRQLAKLLKKFIQNKVLRIQANSAVSQQRQSEPSFLPIGMDGSDSIVLYQFAQVSLSDLAVRGRRIQSAQTFELPLVVLP
jgi:hypothetical protein